MMPTPEPIDDRLLDLLADDELPPAARRALLLRLDAEPEGWRRCALALLESQSWHRACASATAPAQALASSPIPRPSPRRRHRLAPLGLAAALVLTFSLGRLSRPAATPPTPALTARHPTTTTPPPRVPPASDASGLQSDPAPYLWSSHGYAIERRRGLVSLAAPDGRQLRVPVEALRIRNPADLRNQTF